MAITIGQLNSPTRDHALNLPQISLINDWSNGEFYKLDLALKKFERKSLPQFSFKNVCTVQVDKDIIASSFGKPMILSKIENILDSEEPVVVT